MLADEILPSGRIVRIGLIFTGNAYRTPVQQPNYNYI